MSKSVSDVDAILDRLRHKSWWIAVPEARVVEWADAEAAVHVAYDCCEAEHAATMTSVIENAARHGGEQMVREIVSLLRAWAEADAPVPLGQVAVSLPRDVFLAAADEVARRFGGTEEPME